MKFIIKTIRLDLTPSFRIYIERRLSQAEKLIENFDPSRGAELWVEVARTTRHHSKGDVYSVFVNLRLPRTSLRATAKGESARAAIDEAKDILFGEIRKYRTRILGARKKGERKRS